jgi:hypothetical protein
MPSKAASISRLVLALKTWICRPMLRAAGSTSRSVASVVAALAGLASTATPASRWQWDSTIVAVEAEHTKAIYWLSRTLAILDNERPRRRRLEGMDATICLPLYSSQSWSGLPRAEPPRTGECFGARRRPDAYTDPAKYGRTSSCCSAARRPQVQRQSSLDGKFSSNSSLYVRWRLAFCVHFLPKLERRLKRTVRGRIHDRLGGARLHDRRVRRLGRMR